jgi:hypothetical protein
MSRANEVNRKLRDISQFGNLYPTDVAYLQRKILAAGEMKSAIKHFLDRVETDSGTSLMYELNIAELKIRMEEYLNVKN